MPRHKKAVQVRPVKDIDAGLVTVIQAYHSQLTQARIEHDALVVALAKATATVDSLQAKFRAVNAAYNTSAFSAK